MKIALKQRIFVTLMLVLFLATAHADDNLIAHRLFQQEDYAEAAEIYTCLLYTSPSPRDS